MNLDNLPFRVLGLKKELKQLHKICDKWNINVGHAALQFVSRKKQISGILIGVDSINHLRNNLKLINEQIDPFFFGDLNKLFKKIENPLIKTNEWKKVMKLE